MKSSGLEALADSAFFLCAGVLKLHGSIVCYVDSNHNKLMQDMSPNILPYVVIAVYLLSVGDATAPGDRICGRITSLKARRHKISAALDR